MFPPKVLSLWLELAAGAHAALSAPVPAPGVPGHSEGGSEVTRAAALPKGISVIVDQRTQMVVQSILWCISG